MDLSRPHLGDWLVGAAAAVLLVSLFLPWYGAPGGGARANAWQAFAVVDLVVLVAALAGLAALALTATRRITSVPLATTALAALAALLALVLCVVRLIAIPDDALGPGEFDLFAPLSRNPEVGRLAGAWLGTAATLALFASALVAMRDERPRRGRRDPAWDPASVETRRLPDRPAAGRTAGGGARA